MTEFCKCYYRDNKVVPYNILKRDLESWAQGILEEINEHSLNE